MKLEVIVVFAVLAQYEAICEVIVKTTSGYLQGTKSSVFNRTLHSFLGVPFAKPPVGDLRFAKPVPYGRWDGIYVAESPSFPCLQGDQVFSDKLTVSGANSSEDCLYLNVWTPSVCRKKLCDKKAVVVLLHGGGFVSGGNSYMFYNGSFLSALGDVVVVVPNYRLGIFGFLDLGISDAAGNQGLYDQLLALKWVRKNIVNFGGDPDKVTLMGQNAGAISAGLHMISPLSRGLFTRAIMQSGSPYVRPSDGSTQTVRKLEVLARHLGCTVSSKDASKNEDVVQCFKWIDGRKLLDASRQLAGGMSVSHFFPTWGNEFLPLEPREAMEQGDIEAVDVLIGTNQNEGGSFVDYFVKQILHQDSINAVLPDEVRFYLNIFMRFSLQTSAKELGEFYFRGVQNSIQAFQAACLAFGDFAYQCPTNYFADMISRFGHKVYMYHFDHRPSFSWWDKWLGAVHFDEFMFVMGQLFQGDFPFSPTIDELRLSARMMKMWTHFIKFGEFEDTKWPEYSKYNSTYMNLNTKSIHAKVPISTYTYIGQGPVRDDACRMWEPYIKIQTSKSHMSAVKATTTPSFDQDISQKKTLASQTERLEEEIGKSSIRKIVQRLQQRLH